MLLLQNAANAMKYLFLSILLLSSVSMTSAFSPDTFSPYCTLHERSFDCLPARNTLNTSVTTFLNTHSKPLFGTDSPQAAEEKAKELVQLIQTKREALKERVFSCKSTDDCTIQDESLLKPYAVMLFAEQYFQKHILDVLQENDTFRLSRFNEVYFLETETPLDREFHFLGTTAVSKFADTTQDCAYINGGYFGRKTWQDLLSQQLIKRFEPAGNIYITSLLPSVATVTVPSINASFEEDVNLTVKVGYDEETHTAAVGSSDGTLGFYAGPQILDDGMISEEIKKRQSHRVGAHERTFFLIQGDGTPVLGFTPKAMSLGDLATRIQRSPIPQGKFDVINLDGGSSTSFKSSEFAFNEKKTLPRFFGVCDTTDTSTQPQQFLDDARSALETYLHELVGDPTSDIFLDGFTINSIKPIDPLIGEPTSDTATVEATFNLFGVNTYQRSCGVPWSDNRSVVGCVMSVDLENNDGERTVSKLYRPF